jgi:hypothetical protein
MRESCKSSGASEARGSGVGERRHGEGGESDRWGPVVRETRERRLAREGVIRKGKCISCKDATDARAGWAGRDDFGLPGRRGRTGRGVGRAESKEKNFQIKIGFLNLPRLWKFVEGDLGGILT